MAWCSVAQWHGVVWRYGMVWCGMAWCSVACCDVTWCDARRSVKEKQQKHVANERIAAAAAQAERSEEGDDAAGVEKYERMPRNLAKVRAGGAGGLGR